MAVGFGDELLKDTDLADGPGGSIYDGRDDTGRFYAHASQLSGDWTIYLAPWACGREGGLALGPFQDAGEAMATADQYVASHIDSTS